jgi:hypothetical protein
MKKLAIILALSAASLVSFGQTYTGALTAEARVTGSSTVNNTTTSVFVAESKAAGTSNEQYSIAEWAASAFGISGTPNIGSVTLNVYQRSTTSSFGVTGTVGIYLLNDTTTALSSYAYNASSVGPEGFGSDISSHLTLLNNVTYTAGMASNTAFNYTLTLSSSQLSYINSQLASNGVLRFVIAAEDNAVASDWSGIGNSAGFKPSLTLQSVPEPSSLLLLAPAALLFLRRRSA